MNVQPLETVAYGDGHVPVGRYLSCRFSAASSKLGSSRDKLAVFVPFVHGVMLARSGDDTVKTPGKMSRSAGHGRIFCQGVLINFLRFAGPDHLSLSAGQRLLCSSLVGHRANEMAWGEVARSADNIVQVRKEANSSTIRVSSVFLWPVTAHCRLLGGPREGASVDGRFKSFIKCKPAATRNGSAA